MSDILPAYTFEDADLVDIYRFAGYPARGTGVILFPFPWYFKYYEAIVVRMQNLTDSEAAVVLKYLTDLRQLEAAILTAGTNMGTDVAAVWTRNKNEAQDRDRLYDNWRRRLTGFLGVPDGPDLARTNRGSRAVIV